MFQCLLIDGENAGEQAIRNALSMTISDEEFAAYVARNQAGLASGAANLSHILVPENNDTMRNSYLILDEYMRLLDNRNGSKIPTVPILEDVGKAFRDCGFDVGKFKSRTGEWYDGRETKWAVGGKSCGGGTSGDVEDVVRGE